LLREYYRLTKPGIIYGNMLTATAGFLLASKTHVHLGNLILFVLGLSLVIAAACVFNNYIDRGIDKRMKRTEKRALVTGAISGPRALTFASILGVAGFALLITYTNWLTVLLGAVALLDYVVLYGISKRRSVHSTLVGSISGSAPIVAGYVAVTGRIDAAAVILFLMLTCWQMPHFYAIAIYRAKDYKSAGLPVLPVERGNAAAKRQMVAYIIAFVLACLSLSVWNYTGYTYTVILGLVSLNWLRIALKGFRTDDDAVWARQVFRYSLIVIMVLSFMVAVGGLLV
jgi:protoheme IX farnesyltransferase